MCIEGAANCSCGASHVSGSRKEQKKKKRKSNTSDISPQVLLVLNTIAMGYMCHEEPHLRSSDAFFAVTYSQKAAHFCVPNPGPPARCPSLPLFGWEGSPTKIDYRKKGTLILTSDLDLC